MTYIPVKPYLRGNILLQQDLVLTLDDPIAGDAGIYLVKQDEIGYHIVTLGNGNVGDSTVDPTPGVVTEFTYRVDDDGIVYWSTQILNPVVTILAPSKITDLQSLIVNTTQVKIKWTAPKGDANNNTLPADSYQIYYSQAAITDSSSLHGLSTAKQTMTPKLPGEEEEYVLTKLIPGKKYYIGITATKTLKGKTRTSVISNVISFYTFFDSSVNPTEANIISLHADDGGVSQYHITAAFDNGLDPYYKDHKRLSADQLADNPNVINSNGTPIGMPSSGSRPGLYMNMFGAPYTTNWYNFDYGYAYFDLEGDWNVTQVWLRVDSQVFLDQEYPGADPGANAMNFNVVVSDNGTDWVQVATYNRAYITPDAEWFSMDIDSSLSTSVKYIGVGILSSMLSAVCFYGVRNEAHTPSGVKYRKETIARNIHDRLGINAFLAEQNPDMMGEISGITRFYNEGDWILGEGWTSSKNEADYASFNPSPNDVTYKFKTSHMWDYDARLTLFKSNVGHILYTANTAPSYLRASNVPDKNDGKPVDPHIDIHDLTQTTNPQNYKHIARYVYNLAGRYGRNTSVNQTYIQPDTASGEPKLVGLNLLDAIEIGNETDKTWRGENGFHNPEEQAAILSAVYDGHKGLLGPGFGIKTADPTMKVTTPGLAGTSVGRLWRMKTWWDKNRGSGDYPLDAINVHFYSVWTRDAQTAMWSTQPSYGCPPEWNGSFDDEAYRGVKFRNQYMPSKEFWVTEVGYDEQHGGTNAPPYDTHSERAKMKSYWLMRTAIMMIHRGVDVITYYWWANTTVRVEDISQTDIIRDTFLTCGFTDGVLAYNDWNRKWLTTGYYIRQFKYELGSYDVKHQIHWRGTKKLIDSSVVFGNNFTGLTAFALQNLENEVDKAIIVWVVDAAFTYKDVKIYVSEGASQIEVISFETAEDRRTINGIHTLINTETDSGGKYIIIPVGECPVLVKSINVGIPLLEPPVNLLATGMSSTAIKLTWTDTNTIENHTTIFMSNDPEVGFTPVYSGLISNAEYTVTGLSEDSNKFFKIQFTDGDSVSIVSNSVGGATLAVLPVPSNFHMVNATTASLQLSWDLSSQDQTKITGFQIFRSLDSTGPFIKIADVTASSRSYTNTGLTSGTNYYYKIRTTDSNIYFSNFSLVLATTTALPGEDSPVVEASIVNFTGSTIKIRFDQEVKDAAGSEGAFTVIRGVSELIPVSISENDPDNTFIVNLILSSNIHNGESIKIGYDHNIGTLRNFANVPVDTFTNVIPVNYARDPSLLLKAAGLNFLNSDHAGEGYAISQGWLDFQPLQDFGWGQAQSGLKNLLTGSALTWRMLAPVNSTASVWIAGAPQQPIYDISPDSYFTELFPSDVITQMTSIYTNQIRMLTISGLDSSKKYNVYAYVTSGSPLSNNYQMGMATYDGSRSTNWVFGKNGFGYGLLADLTPSTTVVSGASSNAYEWDATTHTYAGSVTPINRGVNDITIVMTMPEPTQAYLCAFRIEEIQPISF